MKISSRSERTHPTWRDCFLFNGLVAFILVGGFFLCGGSHAFGRTIVETNSLSPARSAPHCAHWHTIQILPRKSTPKFHFYNKLNPVWWFKNSDDPRPPDWYKPNDKHRKLKWSFRNPMHNFDFYVIGVADKKFHRSGRFPDKNSGRSGWDFEAARYKFIYLPFISYHRPKFDFYFGWRNRGNFGIKFNINPKHGNALQPEKKPSPAASPG